MKHTKKLLAAVMALAMVSAVAPMSAFADTTNVTFDAPPISPAYTITIPASVDLNAETPTATIKAEGVYLDTTKHKQINVTLASAQYVNTGAREFIAKTADGSSSVKYTIGKGTATSGVKVGDTVAEFTADGSVTLNFSEPTGATYADTHTETLTFSISVENAVNNPYAANSVGDLVTFGSYNWYIINKSDNGVTLLMEKSFTDKAYNDSNTSVTWETCTLRTYLNDDFYNSFSAEDKAKIVKTSNTNPSNSKYGTNGGNNTEDYIYLLSIDEANALSKTIRANSNESWWWLRSPGSHSSIAAIVYEDGSVSTTGNDVHLENGVRPVLNLKF